MKNLFIVYILLLVTETSFCQVPHITEQLTYNSIRIETDKAVGTGFFFNFKVENDSTKHIPVIITNKHVIQGATKIFLYFRKSINGSPENGNAFIYEIPNSSKTVVQHPSTNIDLVAIPIGQILQQAQKNNTFIYTVGFSENEIPNDEFQKKEFKTFEEIFMIGYPNGLWDETNNMPIVRKGITATPSYLDYNGKKEFLIDIAAFGGSSGSPIFQYNDSGFVDKKGNAQFGASRLFLLGILYAGPLYTVNGEVLKAIPGTYSEKVKSEMPMNLGYVIKSSEILEFKKVLK
ncbi:Trypsin-like peptidase domain-containing protein [Flavobacterium micromati]|uniref:Trypsin-like peptidase domain-containing protein n=1 Tax=Flavobacterium micromati TaxID=229205 RepID=A0A1M5FPG5_9FLAO|nr:serine protease [Flavobacterium micromati]SHF93398.1 Trypsin-like peptidase domain-containing protein [Flavobacterium micromati]